MTIHGPVVRLVFSLRKQLKVCREANQRLLLHVARQESTIDEALSAVNDALCQRDGALALVVDLRADVASLEEFIAVLTPKEAS